MERTPSTTRGMRYSRIRFTINNYTPDEYIAVKEYPCKWVVVGREIAPTTGTPHLQGAMIFGKQRTLASLKKTVAFKRAHIKSMDGTPEQNLAYCSKEDMNTYVRGDMPEPGKRNDISEACSLIRQGVDIVDLAQREDCGPVLVKYYKGLMQFASLFNRGAERTPPTIIWIYGSTGTGKTRSAVEFGKRFGRPWISNGALRWFDGYTTEKVAILDDFRSDSCTYDFFLRLTDRYDFRVEFKGGFIDWKPEYIIITCWGSPDQLFDLKGQGDLDQLTRRITHTIECRGYPMVPTLSEICSLPGPTVPEEPTRIVIGSSSSDASYDDSFDV